MVSVNILRPFFNKRGLPVLSGMKDVQHIDSRLTDAVNRDVPMPPGFSPDQNIAQLGPDTDLFSTPRI
jgi:hypothetical protein